MNRNIFIKSVLRQPVRAFLLTILVAAAAFALVARVTEFVVVRNELNRIEGTYRSVGILSPTRFTDITVDHDVTRVLDVVEGNRHVMISDTRRFAQGVMADRTNLVMQSAGVWQRNYFNPELYGLGLPLTDHYIIGHFIIPPRLMDPFGEPYLFMHIGVEYMFAGDDTFLRVGDQVFTNHLGQTTTLRSGRESMHLRVTVEEGQMFQQGLWDPFDGLRAGEPALFRATPRYVDTSGATTDPWMGFMWNIRAITGDDGLTFCPDHNPRRFGGYMPAFAINRDSPEGLVFAVRQSDTAALEATLAYLYDDLAMLRTNQQSLLVIETHDLSAMPRFMDGRVTQMLDTHRFPAGRWLTYEDYGNPVAVVPASLALRRRLHVGDTVTLTLRDNPRPAWIDEPTHSVWSRTGEHWWESHPAGWWPLISETQEDWRDAPSIEITVEIVGVYWFTPPFFTNFTTSEIFIPAGLIPEGFGWEGAPQLTGMYSFVLDSPRSEEVFLRQTRAALAEAGFVALFVPTGFEALAAVTDPIFFSIRVNLLVFGAAAFLVLCFAIFFYMRQWRRSVAIAQALGTPRRLVLKRLFTPVVLLWLPAVIAGSVAAWFFALGQAEATLEVLAGYGAEAALAVYWLAVFAAAIIVFVLAGVQLVGCVIVRRPVLEQLQGGTQKRQKIVYVDSGVVPEGFTVRAFELKPLARSVRVRMQTFWRHRLRQIVRMPMKTGLMFALSLLFVFSLGWLNNMIVTTESEIERLWNETIISAELLRTADEEMVEMWISPATWDAIAFSGFVLDSYVEASAGEGVTILGVSHLRGFIDENTKTIADEQLGVLCDDMRIEFFPGFSEADFVYTGGAPIPAVARRASVDYWVREWEFDVNEPWRLSEEHYVQIIGVFDGGLNRAVNRFGTYTPVFAIPLAAHRSVYYMQWPFYGWGSWGIYRPPYVTARFSIDPARNRELDQLRELAEGVLAENNIGGWFSVPLILFMNDYVLYDVVIPLEQTLSLLRVLYPIAIGLVFLLAVGLSLLVMLQNAKNAAIMRVLGSPQSATRSALCTEQLSICLVGIGAGLLLLLIAGASAGVAPLLLAAVYLGGAAIGSVAGAVVVSMRPPLELLQVRE